MHRIDGEGATPEKTFTEGDPTIPVQPTVVTGDWLTDTQENVCRPIEAAGIALVKGDYTQLTQAIRLLGVDVWSDKFYCTPPNTESDRPRGISLVFGGDKNLYMAIAVSGPNTAAGPKDPVDSTGYWSSFSGVLTPTPDTIPLRGPDGELKATAVSDAENRPIDFSGAFPGSQRVSISVTSASMIFTAPATGWLVGQIVGVGTTGHVSIQNRSSGYNLGAVSTSPSGGNAIAIAPVSAGDSCYAEYGSTQSGLTLYIIRAKGAAV